MDNDGTKIERVICWTMLGIECCDFMRNIIIERAYEINWLICGNVGAGMWLTPRWPLRIITCKMNFSDGDVSQKCGKRFHLAMTCRCDDIKRMLKSFHTLFIENPQRFQVAGGTASNLMQCNINTHPEPLPTTVDGGNADSELVCWRHNMEALSLPVAIFVWVSWASCSTNSRIADNLRRHYSRMSRQCIE